MMDSTAATPQLLRRVSSGAVLGYMRASAAVTVTEIMAATGLTRATAISVCDELVQRGWLRELENQRAHGDYRKGRPARRFELDEQAGCVLGMDVGISKATVVVADLRGKVLGRATSAFAGAEISAGERITVIDSTALRVLESVGATPDSVLAVCAGIAAPVDRHGEVLLSQRFWGLFDVGLRDALRDRHGWKVLLENDANLAALGDRWRGAAMGVEDVVVILGSERLGAGIVDGGRLLHGLSGGAGELAFLDMVEGVGDTFGIAALARDWAAAELAAGASTSLRRQAGAEQVFAAAAAGDAVAVRILDRIADRMARVVGAVGTFLNPELVVIGGAVAGSAGVLLAPITERLAEFTATPPRVAVSPLGDAIVTVGAVRCALDYVERHSLDLELAANIGA
ncbi:ROK family transcriptional regulator [Arthrobacter sp. ZBG10]|uniref:ROK family transcriptional regulator n=1 Tax=unclassified Arthrobacter TaxID=235627 RepID=UPI0006819B1C|nr:MULTISPECIES: ROK family transcriptional regulator [unclassified Arthrobacter]KNH17658.1 ROK family transcriptional regulator [Arthrobacter sp. ZBG10]KQR03046.1 ROK family transcriptional regulator [Arthrobacter sp. Leaf141]